jgi:hypothetical protein
MFEDKDKEEMKRRLLERLRAAAPLQVLPDPKEEAEPAKEPEALQCAWCRASLTPDEVFYTPYDIEPFCFPCNQERTEELAG